jgi:hypothetical protein
MDSASLSMGSSKPGGAMTARFLSTFVWSNSLLLIAGSCPAAGSNQEAEEIRRQFVGDYRAASVRLRQLYSNVELKYRNFRFVNGKKVHQGAEVQGTTGNHGWRLMQRNLIDGKPVEEITARNEDYEFTARKQNEAYALTALKRSAAGERAALFLVPYVDTELGRTYLEVAQEERYRPVSYRDEIWRGFSCKALRITIVMRHPETGEELSGDRVYFFSPEDNWVCRGWKSVGADDRTPFVEDRYDYRRVDGFDAPALASVSRWIVFPQPNAREECRLGLDVLEFKSVPPLNADEFRLTSLGLSEPEMPGRRREWWNSYTIAAAILLIVGLALLYMRRRQKAWETS